MDRESVFSDLPLRDGITVLPNGNCARSSFNMAVEHANSRLAHGVDLTMDADGRGRYELCDCGADSLIEIRAALYQEFCAVGFSCEQALGLLPDGCYV